MQQPCCHYGTRDHQIYPPDERRSDTGRIPPRGDAGIDRQQTRLARGVIEMARSNQATVDAPDATTEDATVDTSTVDESANDDLAALGITRKDPPASSNPAGAWERRLRAVPKDGQFYLVMTAQTRKSASQSATAQRRRQKNNPTIFVDSGRIVLESHGEEVYAKYESA